MLDELRSAGGALADETRVRLAAKAFARTAAYDARDRGLPARSGRGEPAGGRGGVPGAPRRSQARCACSRCATARTRTRRPRSTAPAAGALGLGAAEQLHGKELSYNNLLDFDAALAAAARVRRPGRGGRQAQQPVRRRRSGPAPARPTRARQGATRSRRSAASSRFNRPVDATAAEERSPACSSRRRSRPATSRRAARRSCAPGRTCASFAAAVRSARDRRGRDVRSVSPAASLVAGRATRRRRRRRRWKVGRPGARRPTAELADLRFAWRVAQARQVQRHRARQGRALTVGVGAGQMSRVDSVRWP